MLFEIEYNILWTLVVEFFINIGIICLGFFSKNKYAFIGSIRAVSMVFGIELLFGVFFLIVVWLTNSFNLSLLFILQEEVPLIFFFSPILPVIILLVMLDINKSPFDLSEAETELVTGYHTEYGSFFFGLYYLGEYLHIVFISYFISLLLFIF